MNIEDQRIHQNINVTKTNVTKIEDVNYLDDKAYKVNKIINGLNNNQDLHPSHNFYQFYLNEHQSLNCRRLHFIGSSLGLIGMAKSVKSRSIKPVIKGIAAGYACAWVGHFFFEQNKPATFKYPIQSFVSDFRMYADIWRGKVSLIHSNK